MNARQVSQTSLLNIPPRVRRIDVFFALKPGQSDPTYRRESGGEEEQGGGMGHDTGTASLHLAEGLSR